jgi:hypothetical protein
MDPMGLQFTSIHFLAPLVSQIKPPLTQSIQALRLFGRPETWISSTAAPKERYSYYSV